jgi:hypothetical protein
MVEELHLWPRKMSGTKQKERSSPQIVESDDEEYGSPMHDRSKQSQRDTSPGRQRGHSEGEGYDKEDADLRHSRWGRRRPLTGSYRPPERDMRAPPEWEGRYSPAYHHRYPSSSNRAPFRHSRSPEPYRRGGGQRRVVVRHARRLEWSKSGWIEDYTSLPFTEDQHGNDYDAHEAQHRGRHPQRSSPGLQGPSRRGGKAESSMEAPTRRPTQLDR